MFKKMKFGSGVKIETMNTRFLLTLALPLVVVIAVTTVPLQAANAQFTSAQQQALQSLITTGFTNHQPLTAGGQTFSIPYSIKEGVLIGMLVNQPKTSIDVVLAPTQFAKTSGVFTIQIPRHLLDSKNPNGGDTPFKVALDGHGLAWKEMQNTDTYRTLGLYFGASNGFLEIFGTQIAH
jgi:hypothetical protein